MKAFLGKPVVAFFFACMILALLFSLLLLISPSSSLHYSDRTVIYSNGNGGQIMSAVEKLSLPNVKIHTYNEPYSASTFKGYIRNFVVMTLGLAFNWAIVNVIYVRVKRALHTEE